ncbi:MAG: bifunctional diguanylate cyclase/phosphodiesterase [Lachnospiraceae bacterium]|nr:bifunctional diguanylate cyclase/phosphodiesterase [Lachnospiraceae bacterium]
MDQRLVRSIFRSIFTTVSVICLIVSVWLMFRMIAADNESGTEAPVTSPVEVAHRVLFLSSYNPLYFTYEAQAKGLEEGLYPNDIEYDAAFLDSKNYPDAKDKQAFHDFIKSRIDGRRNYEALLVGDDDALKFAMEYQQELFPDIPIIFFGVNEAALAKQAQSRVNITGFYEKNYLSDTVNLAVRLFPERKDIVALHDESSAGVSDMKIFNSLRINYPGLSFSGINTSKLTEDELAAALEELDDDCILIYMTAYIDGEGHNHSMESRTGFVVEHTKVPIFRNYIGGEGLGILGGVSMDFEAQCREAGLLAAAFIEGRRDISDMKLNNDAVGLTEFDYRLMEDYGLDPSVLPADTVFYNKPVTFREKYGSILAPVGLIALALILLLISSQMAIRTAKLDNAELMKAKDELELSKEEMQFRAEHDDLMGLLNRRTARERLRTELSPGGDYSMVMADIDCFKSVNEGYGHQITDAVLKNYGVTLKELCDKNGWFVSRYGGDQFLIMIPERDVGVTHPGIEALLELFARPVPAGDGKIELSASIGISNSDGETGPEQHIINAENAMYEAKNRGGNGAFLYADEMKKKQRQETKIKEKLMEAFNNDGFYMLYQPKVNAETRQLDGFEALVRMKEPGIFPGDFIPVAEMNGWIWRIGRITTELVIKQLAKWRDEGFELHPVSVNFSSNQINDTGYVKFVEDLMTGYNISPEFLEIEITEGMFLDRTAQAESLFQRFRELGIRLLMDDFGTGYSSLGYLTYIPVDVIKLDKSLVDSYLVDGKDLFIRDVIQLVHDLDKEMIIEGVEEKWQYERLREFKADTIQGYYFSRPIEPDEAIKFKVREDVS